MVTLFKGPYCNSCFKRCFNFSNCKYVNLLSPCSQSWFRGIFILLQVEITLLLCEPAYLISSFYSKIILNIIAITLSLWERISQFPYKSIFILLQVEITLLLCESAYPSSNSKPESIFTTIADTQSLWERILQF